MGTIGDAPRDTLNAPSGLRGLKSWVIWRYDLAVGEEKPRKVPYYAEGGKRHGTQGAPQDRAALVTFDEAVAACKRRDFTGVGIAMLPEWGLVGLDFDHCVDAQGNVERRVEALVADSYCELSPSGTGVHAFMRGTLPDKKSKPDEAFSFGFETFHGKGFLTFTGKALGICTVLGNEDHLSPLTQDVLDHYAARFGAAAQAMPALRDSDDPLMSCDRVGLSLEEAEGYLPGDNEDYDTWLNVGMALKHEFQGSGEALDIWDRWGSSASNYAGRDDLERRWAGFGRNSKKPITMRTFIKLKRGAARPADAPFESVHATTDAANAARLAKTYGGQMAYTPAGWFVFNGTHWEHDEAAAIRRGMNLSRIIAAETAQLSERSRLTESPDDRARLLKQVEALAKFGVRSEDTTKIMAALSQAKNLLKCSASRFDADPWLLNCPNGTVDLRTGELRAHSRDDYLSRITPVPFNPKASRKGWERALAEIIPVPEVVAFLKRVFGYYITGLVIEQIMLILWGYGANGKSTLLEVVQSTLGCYVKAAPPRLLEDSRGDRHPTELADLWNARMVLATETEEGGRLREAFVKMITGGERIKARFMHQDFFEFEPTHKLILSTNHKPSVHGTDHAIWRRLLLVPFEVIFGSPEEVAAGRASRIKDTKLLQRLHAEREGVLAWLVEGCLEWQREGLNPPRAVLAATERYRSEMDKIKQFIDERCSVDSNAESSAADLYRAYSSWAHAYGYRPLSDRGFSLRLQERGFTKGRNSAGVTYAGIAPICDF